MALRDWLRLRHRQGPPSDRDLVATFRRALLAVLEGDYDRAEELISAAVKADSEDVEPYRSLARLYRLRGEVGRAIRIHQNLLLRRNLDPAQRNAVLLELAADFRQGGLLKRAIASYQEALEHVPKSATALEALRDLLGQAGDHAGALEASRRLERVSGRRDPATDASLQVRMAEAEHAQGRHDLARKGVKRALRRDPSNADARMLLAVLEAERGRDKAALAAWRTVAERGGPRTAEALPKLEASFAAVGSARDFETFVRRILEQRPGDSALRLALAGTLAARGEIDPALVELRRVLNGHPSDHSARVALGRLLLQCDRDADALGEYAELLAWLEGQGRGGSWEEA
jgi:lipopolysaccharide biosynthesis regulator YciM